MRLCRLLSRDDYAVECARQGAVQALCGLLMRYPDRGGLVGTAQLCLQELVARQPGVLLEVEASAHGLRWPPDVEYAMFMMVREALDAVIDAGRAHLVRIVLEGDARQLCVAVIDDAPGAGDGATEAPEPLWRVALREHALSIRARLSFAPTAEGLNRVHICWDNPPP